MGQGGLGGGWDEGGTDTTNNSNIIYDATASGTDAYTTPAITGVSSLFTNLKIIVQFTNANTGASTLQIDAFAVVPIVKNGGAALVTNDIVTTQKYLLEYDGANFKIVGQITVQETTLFLTGDQTTTLATIQDITELVAPLLANSTYLVYGFYHI